jgi:hypothetical protein
MISHTLESRVVFDLKNCRASHYTTTKFTLAPARCTICRCRCSELIQRGVTACGCARRGGVHIPLSPLSCTAHKLELLRTRQAQMTRSTPTHNHCALGHAKHTGEPWHAGSAERARTRLLPAPKQQQPSHVGPQWATHGSAAAPHLRRTDKRYNGELSCRATQSASRRRCQWSGR